MPGFSSYTQVGAKEKIDDLISDITPTEFVFQTMVGSDSVKSTEFSWQEDKLRSPAKNAKVEGFDAVPTPRNPTYMRRNVTQIISDTFQVTGTADERDVYGRDKESARFQARTATELKGDLEIAYIGTGQTLVEGDDTTAREMAGVQAQIVEDATVHAAAAGSTAPLSEDLILQGFQKAYDNGAMAQGEAKLLVKPLDARKIAGFAGSNGRNRDLGNGTKIVNVVDVYECELGRAKVVLSRHLKTDNALLFQPSMWKRMNFRNWFTETLAKTGDNIKRMTVYEGSLKHRNWKGSVLFDRLS